MSLLRSTSCTDFTMNVILLNNLGKRKHSVKVWKYFTDLFNVMPIAALID